MSMLAERKRKAKWIIHSAKKPLWDTDSEGIKFGKELMEKMGWSAGKGLGINEQGIKEPVKVSHKIDTKGVGYKGNEETWTKQQDEFNNLLSELSNSLNVNNSNKNLEEFKKSEIASLEEKSKKSRARVHYQKFTRGKDLSRYNENDLACILGTGKVKKQNDLGKEKEHGTDDPEKKDENTFGFKTINSGSLEDYFKKKWLNKKKNHEGMNNLENEMRVENQSSIEAEEQTVEKKERVTLINPLNESNNLIAKNEKTSDLPQFCKKNTESLTVEELNEEKYLEKLKKKKRKKDKGEKIKGNKKSKSKHEISVESQNNEEINENGLDDSACKKLCSASDIDSCDIGNKALIIDCQNDKENVKAKKKKHKSKEISSINIEPVSDLNAIQINTSGENNIEDDEKKCKKNKQKHKKKIKVKEEKLKNHEIYEKTIDEALEINKKSRKKNKKIEFEDNSEYKKIDSPELNSMELHSEETSNTFKKKKKSKKKKIETEMENEMKEQKDLNNATKENEKLNTKSEKKSDEKLTDSKTMENSENKKVVDQENGMTDGKDIVEGKQEMKNVSGKDEINDVGELPSSNNKFMFSIHTQNKKLNYNRVMKLMYGASIDKFIGSNLSGLPGYGNLLKTKSLNTKAA